MLSPGIEKCPACGARLPRGEKDAYGWGDIFWISVYIIGIALIPILFAVGIGMLCVLLAR